MKWLCRWVGHRWDVYQDAYGMAWTGKRVCQRCHKTQRRFHVVMPPQEFREGPLVVQVAGRTINEWFDEPATERT